MISLLSPPSPTKKQVPLKDEVAPEILNFTRPQLQNDLFNCIFSISLIFRVGKYHVKLSSKMLTICDQNTKYIYHKYSWYFGHV